MNRLVINTANDELLVVLGKDNKIFYKTLSSKMHHNETMLPLIDQLLSENNLSINDINELGVVVGPGSFTGIRVGIATIKAFRDALNIRAKGINNLDFLYKLAKKVNSDVDTVAIASSKNSYFVGKLIHGIVYKYERNLTLDELKSVANNKVIGMFKQDDSVDSLQVSQDAETLLECIDESSDFSLIPVYYQLSQAENEKLKKSEIAIDFVSSADIDAVASIEKDNIVINAMSYDQIQNCFNNEAYVIFKAAIESEIAAFIILQKSDELNIDSIAVKKEYRNLGIATKLIKRAEEFAISHQINTLSLEVSYTNIPAFLLYTKLGFVERRVRKNYYQDGSNAVEMIKNLK